MAALLEGPPPGPAAEKLGVVLPLAAASRIAMCFEPLKAAMINTDISGPAMVRASRAAA